MKVIYVGGWGRSGSTIIGNILNEIEDFLHVGELRFIWENGFIHNRCCGCGKSFYECPLWSQVARRTEKSEKIPAPDCMAHARDVDGIKNPDVILQVLDLREPTHQQSKYTQAISSLYEHISAVSGCSVIVDSSKTPSHGFTLYKAGLDVHFIHLVRDPRATAYSWQRKMLREDMKGKKRKMESYTPFANAKRWMICNATMEMIRRAAPDRYTLMRYEDFVERPRRSIEQLLDDIGFPTKPLPFRSSREVYLGKNHTVWGNPKRTRTGRISIYNDNEWEQSLTWRACATVTALTWPLLVRYGYNNLL